MLFSRRSNPVPETYRYKIPELVRSRIFHILKAQTNQRWNADFSRVLDFVEDQLLAQRGALTRPTRTAAKSDHPAIDHLFECTDEEVLDFLEICFQHGDHCGGESTVEAINQVFEEENIGFELTAFRHVESSHKQEPDGPVITFGHTITPVAIKKDEKLLHAETVRPCLHTLLDPRFNTASDELLKAFEEYRRGDYGDAITDAGAAYETVMKTICTIKNWQYDPQKDTASKLIEICRDNKLFPSFYAPVLTGTATIRNKLGDAHGKGPQPDFQATKELADHMLYSVCTNINLLLSLAKV
jgi:hypothetical protein